MENFDNDFVVRLVGVGLWQVFNRHTNQAVSPQCSDKDAAIYYVKRELKQDTEDSMDEMLGADNDLISIHDVDSLRSRFPPPIKGDGSEEKF